MAEKISRLLNEYFGRIEVYAHHGSLSRELRSLVEDRMKEGELSAVVATNSLELGIDIGRLEEVVCVQTPFSVAGAVQRAGRSGHGVGETSRVTFCPLHGMDLLSSAVLSEAVRALDIEESRIPRNPLDLLAQVILSMTAMEPWKIDELYDFLRTCFTWHELPRRSFESVLDMLSGRFADTKIHELSPRIILDRETGTVEARGGVLPILYSSGGSIPDRGYYQLRMTGSGALIGELDEEFVWERKLNEVFTLGNQTWRITKMDERTVEVVPARRPEAMTPFWRAEPRGRSYHFCRRIRDFFDAWCVNGEEEDPERLLAQRYRLEERTTEELSEYIKRQAAATGGILPGLHRIVLEWTGEKKQVVLHTFWGWEVNAPFALALARSWEERSGRPVAAFYTDACVLLDIPEGLDPMVIPRLITPEEVPGLLRKSLELTGLFGAMFRENAARALLIPRSTGRKRIPLWMSRLRSKKLFEAVSGYDDFPILAETWRSCLEDLFDLPNLTRVLVEVSEGRMAVETVYTNNPSPFAADVFYQHTNFFMYADDTPDTASPTRLRDDYIRDLVFSTELRPRISAEVIEAFERRIQRTEPGYSPNTVALILDWVRQRRFLTEEEWKDLFSAVVRDHGFNTEALEDSLGTRIRWFRFPGGGVDLIALPGEAKKLAKLPPENLMPLVAEWITWFGPVAPPTLRTVFGLTEEMCQNLTAELIEQGDAVPGPLGESPAEGEICSVRSLEILLRLKRRMARPSFEPLPAKAFAPFLARWSGIIKERGNEPLYEDRLEKLLFYPAAAGLWEEDLLPVRVPGYNPERLDLLLSTTGLTWLGCGQKRLLFAFREEWGLLAAAPDNEALKDIFPHPGGFFHFWDLKDYSGKESALLSEELWKLAWQGRVTTRGFETIRRGVETGFKAHTSDARRGGRGDFNRWEQSRQTADYWEAVVPEDEPADLLEEEELNRERVRILLSRYGVISKPLLDRELPAFHWKNLFPSLRLMEFSGEVVSGIFFRGLPGPQFASPEAVRFLEDFKNPEISWWINASDPASLCGLRLDEEDISLPRRIPSNRLLYRGSEFILTMKRSGRELDFHVEPNDPRCMEAGTLFSDLLGRAVRPINSIRTERVNNLPVHESPYRPVLEALGFKKAYKGYILRGPV